MRHYEIVFLIHPDQRSQANSMVERYRSTIEKEGGKIHRFEEWGMRKLAYSINGNYKAYYVLMNVECTKETLEELRNIFRFNDAVIRSLVLKRDGAITSPSPLLASIGEEDPDAAPAAVVPDTPLPNDSRESEKRGE